MKQIVRGLSHRQGRQALERIRMRLSRHGIFSEARSWKRDGWGRGHIFEPQTATAEAYQVFRGGVELTAASPVRATVAKALRVGKAACHQNNFTAFLPLAVKRRPSHRWVI